eukprot:3998503-Amphidinium_carterae.1
MDCCREKMCPFHIRWSNFQLWKPPRAFCLLFGLNKLAYACSEHQSVKRAVTLAHDRLPRPNEGLHCHFQSTGCTITSQHMQGEVHLQGAL